MIMNIMLATLLMANSVDYQEIRVAIVCMLLPKYYDNQQP